MVMTDEEKRLTAYMRLVAVVPALPSIRPIHKAPSVPRGRALVW